ncbi:MAG: enoyl-CoA hydratase/isomerase family protein [Actinobacteria bacterium]|nr:MAG: enoyl-CoA hydratase/isomerase family protein [Actinomycetota bacterium]
MSEFVHVERGEDGVAILRLDRPPANALSVAVLGEIAEAARGLTADPPGAVVVTGGDKIFAAGADIAEFGGPEEAARISGHFREAFDAVADIPRMTIAAVAGYALGGGCELALACDLRVASDTATFGQPEVQLGIIPGAGGTQRLTRLVGPARAKDVILSGRRVTAGEALNIGLCDRIFPAAVLQAEARAMALSFATGAVAAHALAKRAIDAALEGSLADGLSTEQELFVQVFETDDAKTGVQSFLANGPGKAKFTGR